MGLLGYAFREWDDPGRSPMRNSSHARLNPTEDGRLTRRISALARRPHGRPTSSADSSQSPALLEVQRDEVKNEPE